VADTNAWIALGGPLVGGALSVCGGFLAQWMTHRREREARQHERTARQIEADHRRQQAQTDQDQAALRELQDAMSTLMDAFAGCAAVKLPPSGEPPAPRAQAEAELKVYTTLTRQVSSRVRVGDDRLREAARQLGLSAVSVMVSTLTVRGFTDISSGVLTRFHEANERLGELLRALPYSGPRF
jgi:hypothetical protein